MKETKIQLSCFYVFNIETNVTFSIDRLIKLYLP